VNEGGALKDEEIRIEPFRPEDLDAIMEIEDCSFTAQWSRKSYGGLWPQKSIDVWVAWQGDELVGYYLVQTSKFEQELHTFAVKPELRRRGIGRLMMDHMLEKAKGRGVEFIYLQVRPSNQEAKELYKSLGFVGIGMRRNYYRDNFENALVMGLKLKK
jgi:ribosomal-protein-alanine N-acetyltransferase